MNVYELVAELWTETSWPEPVIRQFAAKVERMSLSSEQKRACLVEMATTWKRRSPPTTGEVLDQLKAVYADAYRNGRLEPEQTHTNPHNTVAADHGFETFASGRCIPHEPGESIHGYAYRVMQQHRGLLSREERAAFATYIINFTSNKDGEKAEAAS